MVEVDILEGNVEKDILISLEANELRSFFVADRVAFSQIVLLLGTGLLVTFIMALGMAELLLKSYWYIFLFFIPLSMIILIGKRRDRLYFSQPITYCFIPLSIIWLSLTITIGLWVDITLGMGKTFFISLTAALYYGLGYGIARWFRNVRFKYKKETLKGAILGLTFMIIPITAYVGYRLMENAMLKNNIESYFSDDYGKFLNCPLCAFGALFAWSGVAIISFTLCNYCMFHALYEGKSYRVDRNPPNRSYMGFMGIWMMILFIIWILMEFLIPPIAGGGGGDGGGGGGSSNNKKSKTLIKNRIDRASPPYLARSNQEWRKYQLNDQDIDQLNIEYLENF